MKNYQQIIQSIDYWYHLHSAQLMLIVVYQWHYFPKVNLLKEFVDIHHEIVNLTKYFKENFQFKQFNHELYHKSMQNIDDNSNIFPFKQDCNAFFRIMNDFYHKIYLM